MDVVCQERHRLHLLQRALVEINFYLDGLAWVSVDQRDAEQVIAQGGRALYDPQRQRRAIKILIATLGFTRLPVTDNLCLIDQWDCQCAAMRPIEIEDMIGGCL